ncbi:MAG: hypothetical protein QM808_00260 [Steroidobacteraceae bacterium]
MNDNSTELLKAVREIRNLLELLAEPAIAERDAKLRNELRQLVGSSKSKQESVLLMDGTRTQSEIKKETNVNAGHLSTLVSAMGKAKLLIDDPKRPKLAISIPLNFFEGGSNAK